jgi:hypothetical protein
MKGKLTLRAAAHATEEACSEQTALRSWRGGVTRCKRSVTRKEKGAGAGKGMLPSDGNTQKD